MNSKLNMPTLETVKKGIDELLLVDKWDRYKIKSSPKKFEKRLNELFISNLKIMPFLIYLATDKSLPKKFYRLRKQTNTFNEKLISEYSYPPNHFVKTVQRANIPYHPVFYCSDNPYTAITETIKDDEKLNSRDYYYMSEWLTKDNQELRICPFIFDNLPENNPYKILIDINRKKVFEQFTNHTEEEKNGLFEILKFLSNLFTFENTYVVSSYLAYINLYAPHNLRPDVFIYPSVQTQKRTVNFAIHPNAVIEKLFLNRIFKLRIPQLDKKMNKFTALISWVGQNNNGIISWTEIDKDTIDGKEMISEIDRIFQKG
ncbi:MAG: hypothetical protein ABI921_01005 [Panacibacter sp.]